MPQLQHPNIVGNAINAYTAGQQFRQNQENNSLARMYQQNQEQRAQDKFGMAQETHQLALDDNERKRIMEAAELMSTVTNEAEYMEMNNFLKMRDPELYQKVTGGVDKTYQEALPGIENFKRQFGGQEKPTAFQEYQQDPEAYEKFKGVGKKRQTLEGADGHQYYPDTQERVLPGVEKPQEKVEPPKKGNPQKLRKEFTGLSGDYVKVRDSYTRVVASAQDPSAAGDLALIFNYMKTLDPGSVVRESEFATAAASGAFDERINAAVRKVVAGERLSEEMRNDFVDRAKRLYVGMEKQHAKRVKTFARLAEGQNLDPLEVAIDLLPPEIKEQILPEIDEQPPVNAAFSGVNPETGQMEYFDAQGNKL